MNRTSNRIAIRSAIALLAITSIVLPELGLSDDKSAKAPESTTAQPTERFSVEQMTFFEAKIRPILINRCGKCHLNGTAKGSLALDDRQSLLKGGDNGPAITLNDLKASLILSAINYDTMEMPPSGKLPKPEIELLTKWVNDRAPMPNESSTKNKTENPNLPMLAHRLSKKDESIGLIDPSFALPYQRRASLLAGTITPSMPFWRHVLRKRT